MPSATTTKSAMAGTKRKSAPVKEGHVKESKKVKTSAGREMAPKKKGLAVKPPRPAKIVEKSASESSDDDDSDGGVPLSSMSGVEEDEEDEEEENLPSATDGLHPDRVKAVVANSKLFLSS